MARSEREAQKRIQKKREKRRKDRGKVAVHRPRGPASEADAAETGVATAAPAAEPEVPAAEALTARAEQDLEEGRAEEAAARAAEAMEALEGLDASTERHLRNRLGAVQHGRVLGALPVDLGAVAAAMHTGAHGRRLWVDPVSASVVERGPWPGKELKGPGDRFQIPPLDAHEARGLRSLFVSRMEPGGLREILEETLADGARFDEALARDPEAAQQWRQHLLAMLGGRPRTLIYEQGFRPGD